MIHIGDFSSSATLNITTNTGKVRVKKLDEENSKPLEGVTFQLLSSEGKEIATQKTDSNGIATFTGLYQGNYILKEIATGENYVLSSKSFDITVTYNKTTEKVITNKYKSGKLIVNKVDKDDNRIPLENMVFDLYSIEENKVIGTYKTNAAGQIIISDLHIGEYKLIEKDSGKFYNLAEEIVFNIENDKTTEILIQNEAKKGQIKIIKVDKDNNETKLEGIEFEVLNQNDEVLEKLITDKNGEAITSKYALKDYSKLKIREVSTKKEYALSDEIKEIELKENEIVSVIFENEVIKGNIEITKISADDNKITGDKRGTPLKGAIFEIYTEDNELVDTITTDKNGKAISKLLNYGTYYIKEKSTGSNNYLLNTKEYKVEIKENKKTVLITIENESVKPPKKKLPKTGF